jgi:hypothetical protein
MEFYVTRLLKHAPHEVNQRRVFARTHTHMCVHLYIYIYIYLNEQKKKRLKTNTWYRVMVCILNSVYINMCVCVSVYLIHYTCLLRGKMANLYRGREKCFL